MTIHTYAQIVRRRWRIMLGLLATCVIAALLWSVTTTPMYRSSASVYFSLSYGNSAVDLSQGSSYTQAQMESYAMLATSPRVLGEVATMLPFPATEAQLAREVSTSVAAGTVIIHISASDRSPQHAAAIANKVTDVLGVTAKSLSPKDSRGRPTVDVYAVGAARVPTKPAVPATKRNIAAGFLGGLILAFAIGVLRDKLDDKVRCAADLSEVVDKPVLGEVTMPRRSRWSGGAQLPVRDVPLSGRAESYRKLRTNLRFMQVGSGRSSVVITSSEESEGKTTTALNLAFACAEAGDRVLLIDADLRKPAVAQRLGIEGSAGLSSILSGLSAFEDVVQPSGADNKLFVLPSGAVPPNPGQLLSSSQMAVLVQCLADDYDIVILDCPPLGPVTDAALIAHLTSGAVLVAGAGSVSQSRLAESVRALEQGGAKLLGVVLARKRFRSGRDRTYGGAESGRHTTAVPQADAPELDSPELPVELVGKPSVRTGATVQASVRRGVR
ncbi:polysaccharide biosynthesis tyrosine autokinase [Allobranchiibius huperziae]|uniref:non-specific protein-tyrosine kinase n=1 Tax=Allobranchiibius huperziae TaxID=1874116 RepID=A0A853DKM7_9MICO|nr:polysaccharide biosynthesis tyrosine autokinase [Allobranchiibius huperziae]NYJ75544.1 capsular exopolysaccharide synthesis family protein [Allobranchiibius huperziae]